MTINISNHQFIEGEFIIKYLSIIKEGDIFSNFKFDKVTLTKEEDKIIKNFNFSNYNDCDCNRPRNYNNNTSINTNQKNPEKIYKNIAMTNNNNSIIYNNEFNSNNNYNSNNDNIFNKNNSFNPNLNNNHFNANLNSTNNLNFNQNKLHSIKGAAATNIDLNNLITMNNIFHTNPNYSFFKIYIKNLKIIILKRQDILIAGFFADSTSTCIIKGYLLHIFTLYSNYLNDIYDYAKNKYKDGIFFQGFKQNIYFKDNSNTASPIKDKKDSYINPNHFILNSQGNEKNIKGISNDIAVSSFQENVYDSNNSNNLMEYSNFNQLMNKKFFEVNLFIIFFL
jgi:hypothetical protein